MNVVLTHTCDKCLDAQSVYNPVVCRTFFYTFWIRVLGERMLGFKRDCVSKWITIGMEVLGGDYRGRPGCEMGWALVGVKGFGMWTAWDVGMK